MKNIGSRIIAMVVLIMFSGHTHAYSQSRGKAKINLSVDPNGNYKHQLSVSGEHAFQKNFTKPPADSIHTNYKPQNQKKRNVRFCDHFRNTEKSDRHSYKDPEGL